MAKRQRQETVLSSLEDNNSDASSDSSSPTSEPDAHTPKYASLEPSEEKSAAMRCMLPPHKPLNFNTYDEYESHYQQSHTNRCTECRKNFPSSHFLELHIAENHDPITATRRDAGEKTYACFVEGCEKVCSEWKKRRSHLVDKHGFPKNYDFLVVDHGIDGQRSMLRPGIDAQGHRKSSRERARSNSSATEVTQTTKVISLGEKDEDPAPDTVKVAEVSKGNGVKDVAATGSKDASVDDITTSMSSLNMVPRSITFGKRKGRSGFAKS